MCGKSWTRVSNWLRDADNRERAGNIAVVIVFYLVLAFAAGIASIVWRLV